MSILILSKLGRSSSIQIIPDVSVSTTIGRNGLSSTFVQLITRNQIHSESRIFKLLSSRFNGNDRSRNSGISYTQFPTTFTYTSCHRLSTTVHISEIGKLSEHNKGVDDDIRLLGVTDLNIAHEHFDGNEGMNGLAIKQSIVTDFYDDVDNLLTVCILGPPNAGKSTLFNRLTCKESNRSYRLNVDKGGRKGTKNNYKHTGPNNKGRTVSRLLPSSSCFFGRRNGDTGTSSGKNTNGSTGSAGGVAIVSPLPGTTRDTRECIGRIGSVKFRLYDTAGIDRYYRAPKRTLGNPKKKPISIPDVSYTDKKWMMEQTIQAAQASDLIVLLFDARNTIGTTPEVLETARWLRKSVVGTPTGAAGDHVNALPMFPNNPSTLNDVIIVRPKKRVIVCGNKLEGTGIMPNQWEDTLFDVTKKLGFGDVIPLSALHGDVGITEIGTIIDEMSMEKKEIFNLLQSKVKKIESASGPNVSDDWYREMDTTTVDASKSEEATSSTLTTKITKEKPLQIAILGRPNVGKSTLVNQLVQCDRVLTGPTPGLTRDAITIPFFWQGSRPVQIVDTAGIRKVKSRRTDIHTRTNEFAISPNQNRKPTGSDLPNHKQFKADFNNHLKHTTLTSSTSMEEIEHLAGIEEMAVADAIRALKVADVAVLVLDAQAGSLHKHELAICNAILQEGRALIIVANKMDLLLRRRDPHFVSPISDFDDIEYTANDYENEVRRELEERFPMLRKTPIVPMSSLTGEGVQDLLPAVFRARDRWERKISTGRLNQWLQEAVLSRHAPPPVTTSGNHHRKVRIKYIIQTKGRPPTFLLFCSGVGSRSSGGSKMKDTGNRKLATLPESYIRYLTRNFQDTFDMYGMEVRFAVKNSNSKGNPFDQINPKSAYASTVKGYGIGGREGRRKRMIRSLKANGAPSSRIRRTQRIKVNRYR
jgi:GTPase